MPAYLIARVHITDPTRYAEYAKLTPAAIAKHGGRFVVRGGEVTTLEGTPERDRVVVIEFPSLDRAKAFWSSPEYAEAKAKRAGAANGQFILVDGFPG
jgi:uncharacterized protein (DUF1330 family)